MKRSMVGLLIYWAVAIAAIILLTIWAAGVARASIADCIDATCRITAGDVASGQGGRGTGCVFERSQGRVFVLTCAHVVGSQSVVQCEFWRQGHQSRALPGRVTARSPAADAAIVTLDERLFGGVLPKVVPIARRDYVLRPGQTVTSARIRASASSTSASTGSPSGSANALAVVVWFRNSRARTPDTRSRHRPRWSAA